MSKIWIDGCFDIFHYGHANALRKAKSMGTYLIAGVHSTKEISLNKGLPVMTDEERYEVVRACRYVDEIIENAPFVTQLSVIQSHNCHIVVHGNDPIVDENGNDCYQEVKKKGMFREFERTLGISTTEIVGRMLLKQKPTPELCTCNRCDTTTNTSNISLSPNISNSNISSPYAQFHDALLHLFEIPKKERKGTVVYVAGTFDLYHAGHTSLLREAKKLGDFLVVGIYRKGMNKSDNKDMTDNKAGEDVTRNSNSCKDVCSSNIGDLKSSQCVFSYKERQLCLLSNKYIDEVIYDPQFNLDKQFIERFGIKIIVHNNQDGGCNVEDVKGCVKVVKINTEFSYLTSGVIIDRIVDNYYDILGGGVKYIRVDWRVLYYNVSVKRVLYYRDMINGWVIGVLLICVVVGSGVLFIMILLKGVNTIYL
ncbi:putative ethanolamine-phosphate cytidylyltransferase [Hamiltosporidium tvaerminnensis]|uniref:ethanolamine-phosphate cytidylyltransferase n=1 Tax=Hamiltosporidium tvaerminnensis TaxID=1176355 RepID=A0A4Q9LFD5_9MICR|nr:putative ethanolamine-phosphate cytidylyltransferase [Hamiltosporidium tvaerminnensis]